MNEPTSNPQRSTNEDQYWWAPWAVLVGLVLLGALGIFGVFTPKRGGQSAADVPVTLPSAARQPAPRASR